MNVLDSNISRHSIRHLNTLFTYLGALLDMVVLPTRFWNFIVYFLRIKEFRRHILVLISCGCYRDRGHHESSQVVAHSANAHSAASKTVAPSRNSVHSSSHLVLSSASRTSISIRPAILQTAKPKEISSRSDLITASPGCRLSSDLRQRMLPEAIPPNTGIKNELPEDDAWL